MVELRLKGVSFSYGRKEVIRDFSLALRFASGGIVSVVGPNGAGKSTLLGLISGYLRPNKGEVILNGNVVHRLVYLRRRRLVSVIFPDRVVPADIPVWKVVASGRLGEFPDKNVIRSILALLGVEHIFERSFAALSSGERHLVLISSAIYQGADVMLFDEPTSFLDPEHVLKLLEVFPQLAEKHLVVFSSHDLPFVRSLSDTIIGVRDGALAYLGEGKDFWESGFEAVFGVSYRFYRSRLIW